MPRLGGSVDCHVHRGTVRDQYALARAARSTMVEPLLIVEHQRADGTCKTRSAPEWPVQLEPPPWRPRSALNRGVAIAEQRVVVRIRFEIDAAAI